MSEQQPQDYSSDKLGFVGRGLEMIKGLTFTNVLIIILLVVVAAPAYLAWRVINDEELQNLFFSSFETIATPESECGLREVTLKGVGKTWLIGVNFSHQGQTRWWVAVSTNTNPTTNVDDLNELCNTLTGINDVMHRIHDSELKYPNSGKLIFP